MAGGIYVPMQALEDPGDGRADAYPLLSRPQQDVLFRLLDGAPNKRIAQQLDLSEGTVKIHVANILRILGVNNRTEAVVRAQDWMERVPGVKR